MHNLGPWKCFWSWKVGISPKTKCQFCLCTWLYFFFQFSWLCLNKHCLVSHYEISRHLLVSGKWTCHERVVSLGGVRGFLQARVLVFCTNIRSLGVQWICLSGASHRVSLFWKSSCVGLRQEVMSMGWRANESTQNYNESNEKEKLYFLEKNATGFLRSMRRHTVWVCMCVGFIFFFSRFFCVIFFSDRKGWKGRGMFVCVHVLESVCITWLWGLVFLFLLIIHAHPEPPSPTNSEKCTHTHTHTGE